MELKKCAFVLEGGAMKGVFTAGVLDYLMYRDFYPEYVVGVSAGACNAVDYVSKQIGRTRDCFIVTEKDEQYLKFTNILEGKPIYDMDLVFDRFPNEMHPFDYDTFFASKMKCEVVTTNLSTGEAEYMIPKQFDRKHFTKVCRASSSMPLFADIVVIDHKAYLDGGIADSIPIKRALELGYEKIIVVQTKNKGYRKKPTSGAAEFMLRQQYGYFPKFIDRMLNRNEEYNETADLVDRLEEEGKIFVIRPSMPAIDRLEQNYKKCMAFYENGVDEMDYHYQEMLEYLQKKD